MTLLLKLWRNWSSLKWYRSKLLKDRDRDWILYTAGPAVSRSNASMIDSDATDMKIFGEGLQLFIRTFAGNTYTFRAKESYTTKKLKDLIQDKIDTPRDQQRLIHAGRQLENGRKISEYKIQTKSILHLVLRLVVVVWGSLFSPWTKASLMLYTTLTSHMLKMM